MNDGQRAEKLKYKAPIGGILCIAVGVISGFSILLGWLNDILSIFIDGGLNYFKGLLSGSDFISWLMVGLSWIDQALALVGALLFIALGIMLIARCHSRLLAIIPIVQIAIAGFSIFCFAFKVIISVLNFFVIRHWGTTGGIVTYTVLPNEFIESLFLLLGWILLTVAVFVNCKKGRSVEDGGRLRPLKWFVPAGFATGYLLSACLSVINAVLSLIAPLGLIYYNYGIIPTLLLGFGGGLLSVITATLYAVTFYFVTDWIIMPCKKIKEM